MPTGIGHAFLKQLLVRALASPGTLDFNPDEFSLMEKENIWDTFHGEAVHTIGLLLLVKDPDILLTPKEIPLTLEIIANGTLYIRLFSFSQVASSSATPFPQGQR
jgi:hypothetical protein